MSKTLAEALQFLIGEQLSSVEFVQDYVQLRFDGPHFSVYNPHRITSNEVTISWGEPCYCDTLCKLIGQTVKNIQILEGKSLTLTFDGPIVWTISLLDSDYQGPTGMFYEDKQGECWVV